MILAVVNAIYAIAYKACKKKISTSAVRVVSKIQRIHHQRQKPTKQIKTKQR